MEAARRLRPQPIAARSPSKSGFYREKRGHADATATAAVYEVALERIFGSASGKARDDRAHNGSRPDHPLHSAYVAKTKAAVAWSAEKRNVSTAAARGR
jgi:hypothetical protein